jgi:hypothetical protein
VTACEGVRVPVMKSRGKDRARRKKRRFGDRAKELLACFTEAGRQMGKLSDEAVLDVVRCCREKKTKVRQSGTKDGKKEVLPRTSCSRTLRLRAAQSWKSGGGQDAGIHLPMAERRLLGRERCE